MSQQQTSFEVLPNELVCYILEFLTIPNILRAFLRLTPRYDDLVRFYINRLDVTDGWQGDSLQLQWISIGIETLKIDEDHIHLLTAYHYPRLSSLSFVNVYHWNQIISNMSLKSLSVWLDRSASCYHEQIRIPNSVISFSTNGFLKANAFHTNLLNLNVRVCSVVHLLEIIEQTPNIERLSVTFYRLDRCFCEENFQPDRFKTMTKNFRSLHHLARLSFSTMDANGDESNERLPFDQIQVFIDQCCPSKTILKTVVLKFFHIMLIKNMWSTIMRFKQTFDRFDFYASFIFGKSIRKIIEKLSINDDFAFHVEGCDSSRGEDRYVHIYSLPFTFGKLHGFTSCSELTTRSSFSTVRYLYFSKNYTDRLISFESLAKRMPRLISIDCHFTFLHDYNTIVPQVDVDRSIFNHVRQLRFRSRCPYRICVCCSFLPRLLEQMPRLESFNTSNNDFIHDPQPLPSIKRLEWSTCDPESFDILAQRLPNLSILSLGGLPMTSKNLCDLLYSIFTRLPSVTSVSFTCRRFCSQDQRPFKEMSESGLAFAKTLSNRLRHLKLDYGGEYATYYLEKS